MYLATRGFEYINTSVFLPFKVLAVKSLEESRAARVAQKVLQGAGWSAIILGGLMLGGVLGINISKYSQLDPQDSFSFNHIALIRKACLELLGGIALLYCLNGVPKTISECSLEELKLLMHQSIRTSNFNFITQILNQRHFTDPTLATATVQAFVENALLQRNFEAAIVIFTHPTLNPLIKCDVILSLDLIINNPDVANFCHRLLFPMIRERPEIFNLANIPARAIQPVIHEPLLLAEDNPEVDLDPHVDHIGRRFIYLDAIPINEFMLIDEDYFDLAGADLRFHDAIERGDLERISSVMERVEVSLPVFESALEFARNESRYDIIKQMLLSSSYFGSTGFVKELLKERYWSWVPHEMLEAFEMAATHGHNDILEAFILHNSFTGPIRDRAALILASSGNLKSYKTINLISFFSSSQLKNHLEAAVLSKNIGLVQYIASLRQLRPEHKREALEFSKAVLDELCPELDTNDAFCDTVFRTSNLIDILRASGRFIVYLDDKARDTYSVLQAAVIRPEGRIESQHLVLGSARIQTMYRLCQEASFCFKNERDFANKQRLDLLNKALKVVLMQGF